MSNKLILIIKSDTVLARGVMSILERESDLVILEVQPDHEGFLPNGFQELMPDVIILEAGPNTPFPILHSHISKHFPQTPVIVINTLEDRVKLYVHREISIKEPADLISTIRNIQAQKEDIPGEHQM